MDFPYWTNMSRSGASPTGTDSHSISDSNAGENTTIAAAFTTVRLCLAIFGVVANTVTAIALTNKKLWNPTSMLLLSLVVYDAVFLFASIPACVTDVTKDKRAFAILVGVFYPLRYMAQTGSIYTTVTVTIERFLIVLRPLKARTFCTFGKTRKAILGVFLFSVVFNIPRCFFYHLFTSITQIRNVTVAENNASILSIRSSLSITTPQPMVEETGAVNHSQSPNRSQEEEWAYYAWLYLVVYELYVSSAFFYLLPYTLIPVLNLQLLLAIKSRRKETRRLSVKNQHQLNYTKPTSLEDGLTMIVLGITVCFCICCLIPVIYNVIKIADVPSSSDQSYYLLTASDTMLCINASADFFFYCLLGRKFRIAFMQLVCPRTCIKNSRTATHYKSSHKSTDTCYHTV